MLNYLMQNLKELKEINRKLDKLDDKDKKINIVSGVRVNRARRITIIGGIR